MKIWIIHKHRSWNAVGISPGFSSAQSCTLNGNQAGPKIAIRDEWEVLPSQRRSAGAVLLCVIPHWGRDKEEWRVFHPFSKYKLLTRELRGGWTEKNQKHFNSSILLNLNKSPWDCTNAAYVFWPTKARQQTASGLLREPTKTAASFCSTASDLSPVFNTLTCEIPDQGLTPAWLLKGQRFCSVSQWNRTNCNLVPEECHSRALHRETLTTGPNWNFNYVKIAVPLHY